MTRKIYLTLFSIFLAITTCMSLFLVKYEVVKTEDELYKLNKKIISYQKEIHILKAEFAHLTDPKRLRKLANKYTKLKEVKPFQVIAVDDLRLQDKTLRKVAYKNRKK